MNRPRDHFSGLLFTVHPWSNRYFQWTSVTSRFSSLRITALTRSADETFTPDCACAVAIQETRSKITGANINRDRNYGRVTLSVKTRTKLSSR